MTTSWIWLKLTPDTGQVEESMKIPQSEVIADVAYLMRDPHNRIVGTIDEGSIAAFADEGQSATLVFIKLTETK